MTGSFTGTAAFGTTTKTSAGSYDLFVAKYNTDGTLQWVQSAGGTNGEYGNDITVDGSGNVYVTGYFLGTVTFGTTTKTSAGNYDLFVVKYNTTGTLQWVQTAGGTGADYGYGIAVDGSGNVYVTGSFFGTATFGAITKASAGADDIFVGRYDPVGVSWSWVQSAGGTLNEQGNGIALDAIGNVYVTGFFTGTATFGTTSKVSAGGLEVFVTKYSSAGTIQWVQSAGGTGNDYSNSLAVDDVGSVYLAGAFTGTGAFGTTTKTSAGNYDLFVARYDPAGTLQWVQTAGGTNSDEATAIALDSNGNAYVTGSFYATATFGRTSKASAGLYDMFIGRLDK